MFTWLNSNIAYAKPDSLLGYDTTLCFQEHQKRPKYLVTKTSKCVKAPGSPKDKLALIHFTDVKGALQNGEDKRKKVKVPLVKELRKQKKGFLVLILQAIK